MSVHPAVALAVAALAATAPASSSAGRLRPTVSLSASPSTLAVPSGERRQVTLTNFGSSPLVVRVSRSGLSIDLRGRPRLVRRPAAGRNAAAWLSIRPRKVAVPAGGSRFVTVAVRLPPRAQPGDHHAAVVLSTRPLDRIRIGVRVRLAVRVAVRAPGVVRRRLVIRSLRALRMGPVRRLDLRVSNRGNVTEELARRISVSLGTAPPSVVVVPGRRELLPGRDALVSVTYRGRHRGVVAARVAIRGAGARTFRVRL